MVEQIEFLGSRNGGENVVPAVDNSVAYSPSESSAPSNNIETTDISEDPYKDFGDEFTLSSDDLPF